jgi:hypothetical protein
MRIQHITAIAALMAAFVIGCSKHPSQSASHLPQNTKDLGAVELVEGLPQNFSLGDGKSCTLTGKQLSDGIDVKVVVLTTNADGVVMSSQGEITTSPGRQCAIGIGDTMVGLTPTLKKP